jgi:hypothetical protein
MKIQGLNDAQDRQKLTEYLRSGGQNLDPHTNGGAP